MTQTPQCVVIVVASPRRHLTVLPCLLSREIPCIACQDSSLWKMSSKLSSNVSAFLISLQTAVNDFRSYLLAGDIMDEHERPGVPLCKALSWNDMFTCVVYCSLYRLTNLDGLRPCSCGVVCLVVCVSSSPFYNAQLRRLDLSRSHNDLSDSEVLAIAAHLLKNSAPFQRGELVAAPPVVD